MTESGATGALAVPASLTPGVVLRAPPAGEPLPGNPSAGTAGALPVALLLDGEGDGRDGVGATDALVGGVPPGD